MDRSVWYALDITALPEAAEAVEFALNELDALGTEITDFPKQHREAVTVTGYFHSLPDGERLHDALNYGFQVYGIRNDAAVLSMATRDVENTDWLAEWKKHWNPTHIGHFVIAAPWHEVDDAETIVIRIEPNMAFGTGTHETTQLCLKAIDAFYETGDSFLDVGTGTGILAIAAAKFTRETKGGNTSRSECAHPNFAMDTDPDYQDRPRKRRTQRRW